jgi:hypothetical protein
MRKRRAGIFFAGGVIFTLLPYIAYAAGLVPCGDTSGLTPGSPAYYSALTSCQACSLIQLIQNIITFLIGLSIPIAMVLFAYAGVLYFTSAANEENINKAKSIFKNVFIGFIIVLGAYLMIDTLLHTILDSKQYPQGSWFTIQCITDPSKRPTQGTLDNLLNEVVGNPQGPVVVVSTFHNIVCPAGAHPDSTLSGGTCISDTTNLQVAPISVTSTTGGGGGGSCSAYGLSAQQSCIATYESSCNPGIGSSVDIGSDGKPVSFGLFQINISANDVQCSNINGGQPLDCTSAFKNGAYTATNHATAVADEALFQTCKNAVQNVDCNKQMQQKLQAASGGSLAPWGTPARNNCSSI